MIQCPKCGINIPDDIRFCTSCGYPVYKEREKTEFCRKSPLFQKNNSEEFTLPQSDASKQNLNLKESVQAQQEKQENSHSIGRIIAALVVSVLLISGSVAGAFFAKNTLMNPKKEDPVQEARQLLEQERYDECESYAMQALDEDPNNQQLLIILGEAQAAQEDYTAAAGTYSKIDLNAMETENLPTYVRTMAACSEWQLTTEGLDLYLDESDGKEASELLADVAQTAAIDGSFDVLERCVIELENGLEKGWTDQNWNAQVASGLVEPVLLNPTQQALEAVYGYFLKSSSQLGQGEAEDSLVKCYAAWRKTDADLLQADWSCYQALSAAAEESETVLEAYKKFLSEEEAKATQLLEELIQKQEYDPSWYDEIEVKLKLFSETILQSFVQQNSLDQVLAEIESEILKEDYNQAMSVWKSSPYLKIGQFWYESGKCSFWPSDSLKPALCVNPDGISGIYYGYSTSTGEFNGMGVMLIQLDSGPIQYREGTWVNGETDSPWIELDGDTSKDAEEDTDLMDSEDSEEKKSSSESKTTQKSQSSSQSQTTQQATSSSQTTQQATSSSQSQGDQQADTSSKEQTGQQSTTESQNQTDDLASLEELQEQMRQAEELAQGLLESYGY